MPRPTFLPSALEPRLLAGEELVVADHLHRLVEDRLVVAAVVDQRREVLEDDLVVVREGVGGQEVATPDLGPVEPQLARRQVEQPLDDEHPMLAAGAAVGGDDRQGGEDGGELRVVVGDVVGAEQGALAVDRHGQPVGVVGAGVVQVDVLDAEDPALGVDGDLGCRGVWLRSWVVAVKFSSRSSIHLIGRPSCIDSQGTTTSSG